MLCIGLIAILYVVAAAQSPSGRTPDNIWADNVKAVGGQAAVDRFTTRETVVDVPHGHDLTLYWEKPNKVLEIGKKERSGFDGTHGWILSSKNTVKKMAHGAELPLEIDANPLRFVHLKDLYSELDAAPQEQLAGETMDVIVAPNNLASTKLLFDVTTHLLRRVEEKGETSAYFTNTADFLDYREVGGVRMPFRIVHASTEPGARSRDLRVKEITHNVPLRAELFSKPLPGRVVLGGKR
jgi:hypothetical protein